MGGLEERFETGRALRLVTTTDLYVAKNVRVPSLDRDKQQTRDEKRFCGKQTPVWVVLLHFRGVRRVNFAAEPARQKALFFFFAQFVSNLEPRARPS
jgi:hypothetical protein